MMSLNTDLIQLRSLTLSIKEANVVLAQLPQSDGIVNAELDFLLLTCGAGDSIKPRA
jgi:hypothetical protein